MTTVAIASTHTGQGYWLVDSDGSVAAHGDAQELDALDAGGAAIVAAASTPDGRGLWLVDADGTVHALGTAAVANPPAAPEQEGDEPEPETQEPDANGGDGNAPEPV